MEALNGIKAIIFDWGRTLVDNETQKPFNGTDEVLEFCSSKYPLAIVSVVGHGTISERYSKLDAFGWRKHFSHIFMFPGDKNPSFDNAFGSLGLDPSEVLVVDDRMIRLAYPISLGCKSVWVKKGKFANEEPTPETGTPDTVITDLKELIDLLPK